MRGVRWVLACLVAATAMAGGPRRAVAQTDAPPAEVQALLDQISDIDKMRVLGPVKLTAEQLDKLIPAVKEALDTCKKRVDDAAAAPLRDMVKEIKDVRAKVVAGAPIPKDFDEKIKKLQVDFVKQQSREDAKALNAVLDTFTGLLTRTQRATVIAMVKPLAEKDTADDQLMKFYVVGTFMQYGRIVPLLQDMRKAFDAPKESTP